MLRKRGRRVEVLVGKVEEEIKGWLKGEGFFENTRAEVESSGWRVVDGSLVEVQLPKVDLADQPESASMSTGNGRRMPDRHRLREALPPLPPVEQAGTLSAILEYSRSPAHLSWAVMDGFERLVLHLVARYYELVTWSESIFGPEHQAFLFLPSKSLERDEMLEGEYADMQAKTTPPPRASSSALPISFDPTSSALLSHPLQPMVYCLPRIIAICQLPLRPIARSTRIPTVT